MKEAKEAKDKVGDLSGWLRQWAIQQKVQSRIRRGCGWSRGVLLYGPLVDPWRRATNQFQLLFFFM